MVHVGHAPVQHRDGKPPWCQFCGLTADFKTPVSMFDKKERKPMVESTKYVRKPFEVEAVKVTEDNIEAVKNWCQGTLVLHEENRPFIKVMVARALNERQTKAYPGDWVLYAGTGFKVYTAKAFHRTFEPKNNSHVQELLVTAEPADLHYPTEE